MNRIVLSLSLLINFFLIAAFIYLINALGGINYVLFKMNNRGQTGVYVHRKNLFEKLPNSGNEIIFLGDSITEACEWSELFDQPNIKNRGIAGDMTDGVLDRIDEVTASQPSKIFLMVGVNDLIMYRPEYITNNYKKILENIRQKTPNTKIFIQSVLPVNNKIREIGIKNKDITTINHTLEEFALEFGIIYVNLHSIVSDKDGNLKADFTSDGIHLNGSAYLTWKKAIEEYVKS